MPRTIDAGKSVPMALTDQTAIVTGAGSGIGRATALALATEGARVVVADVRPDTAQGVVQEILAKGGRALAVPVDVADPGSVGALVEKTLGAFGQIHVLMNSAGIIDRRPVIEMSDQEWHRVLGVNLHGTFYCCRAVGRHMAERRYGRIINMASDRGTYGMENSAHYATSKGGVASLTKSLALELGRFSVTVNAIAPGVTETPMARGRLSDEEWQSRAGRDPLGRFSQPEEIGRLVVFLAGAGGAFMTGQVVTVRMASG
jgi:3-oxoacyl-[acyl-carrier protein] reductase